LHQICAISGPTTPSPSPPCIISFTSSCTNSSAVKHHSHIPKLNISYAPFLHYIFHRHHLPMHQPLPHLF
jgi:hypothetical protein